MRIPKAGSKCESRKASKKAFAPGSFRWVKSGKGRVLVACPKGQWSKEAGLCRVGLRTHAVVISRKRGAACPTGYKRA